ncbi:uncharacterized protein LOC116207306 [Punica granatum]|uniref:Uncharacterized protein n=2 Tax=Punica granatum TaxID=22663 RepID=A0A218W3C8_PUNGR|nr:uncharacterized protein LOC116207306 [Punica granatum]OWM67364.1 hypothetical protein CDL15_Pgr000816 [Punica granatum]PKI43056.1 hypothetical protein CRG98_036535 [Punica granatum]
MASWKKTIISPFRKACTFFNQQPPRDHKKSPHHHPHQQEQEDRVMDLQGEVMACGYEDVQVMWSMLDKSRSRSRPCTLTS